MKNVNMGNLDDRHFTDKDFEEMFERMAKLSEIYAKEEAEQKQTPSDK